MRICINQYDELLIKIIKKSKFSEIKWIMIKDFKPYYHERDEYKKELLDSKKKKKFIINKYIYYNKSDRFNYFRRYIF